MGNTLETTFISKEMTRRNFIRIAALSSAGFLAGCATDPVTGRSQLMLVSEEQEIQIDRENSPHQFSADYGTIQDHALNAYIGSTGKRMAAQTHRTNMPYSFRAVNATYMNAYAFPGGSIACTRGMLLALENEAELAGLLGHELGHVNARHTAEQTSKGMLISATVGGLATYAGSQSQILGSIAQGLAGIGAGALLAKYSRDNEREADALGMEYMVKSGYNPNGMVGLMDILRNMSMQKPAALELMFATHPMSEERYRTVLQATRTKYRTAERFPVLRTRYMDHTASLRKMKGAIDEMQKGEKEMGKGRFPSARNHFRQALYKAPDDYAGLLMMAKCLYVQKKFTEAIPYTNLAKQVYPKEPQAYLVSGMASLQQKKYHAGYRDFHTYQQLLPGNPNITFLQGYSLEGMGDTQPAANQYHRYLQSVSSGNQAQYAYQRLVQWGYITPAR
ncbi:MAG: M48 family metalloprotease [Deltaproteobacteria bacterium]|nr:M48 family metalloprotease [Deltaproteobacteria bacterium]